MTIQPCKLVSAQLYPQSVLADLLTAAYADYPLPVFVNGEILGRMVDKWDIDLAHSVVAVVDEVAVGLALLAHRDDTAWISGVGVLKAYRQRGIAGAMIAHLQQQACRLGMAQVSLEVLEGNAKALELYTRLGFVRVGAQVTLTKAFPVVARTSQAAPAEGDNPLLPMDAEFTLAFYASFAHPRTAWVRDRASLHRLCAYGLQGLGYFAERTLQGYLLYTAGMGLIDVYDLAVQMSDPQAYRIAAMLLQALEQRSDWPAHVYVISVAEEDPLLEVYQAAGYQVLYREYQMLWQVPDSKEQVGR